jgi:hypothetical protein
MKSIELNSWALEFLGRVERRVPIEDFRVEAKKGWPDPSTVWTARQLAGHANAARGENILWLIGADEKSGKVVGAKREELSDWLAQVKSYFESEYPTLQDQIIDYNGITVIALCFDTSRFPYVIINPAHGKVKREFELEVPWREGTAVRSAKRNDLVLMLTPLIRLPKLQLLRGQVDSVTSGGKAIAFTLSFYVVPVGSESITFPFHRCNARLMVMDETNAETGMVTMNSAQGRQAIMEERFRKSAKMMGGN